MGYFHCTVLGAVRDGAILFQVDNRDINNLKLFLKDFFVQNVEINYKS